MDIEIYEVGPRDGLQNSRFSMSTNNKISLIKELYYAGLEDNVGFHSSSTSTLKQ